VPTATGYDCGWSINGNTWTALPQTTATQVSVDDVPFGPVYFRVQTRRGEEYSTWSMWQGDNNTPPSPTPTPAPTNLVVSLSPGSSELMLASWDAVTGASEYPTAYSFDGDNWTSAVTTVETSVSITVPNGTTWFRVAAIVEGTQSSWTVGHA
jgi:hypothetical protein